MAKSKKDSAADRLQIDLFEAEFEPGSMNIDIRLREEISKALRRCRLSRWQVVAQMSELLGSDVTKAALDSMTAESKEGHRFPLIWLAPFCKVTGTTRPIELVAEQLSMKVIGPEEVVAIELVRLERKRREIEAREAELRRRRERRR